MAELRSAGIASPQLDVDAWIERAQARCIEAYAEVLAASDTGLVYDPALLRAFELEKETYEFLYAARFLPSWLYAPRLGMRWLFRHG
jgi:predicted trehalose synthase